MAPLPARSAAAAALFALIVPLPPAAGAGTPLPPAAGAGTFTNPVVPASDAPDPGVVWCPEEKLYYSTTTTGGLPAFHVRTSPDLASWTDAGYLFKHKLPWAGTDGYWAPEIHRMPDGSYVVYHVARNAATGTLSVGAATAPACAGPWTPLPGPLVTHPSMGQIDPTFFTNAADGKQYLIFKTDGNAVGQPTPIRIAQLTPNGTALVPGQDWESTQLITDDQPWEHGITEAPWLVLHDSTYFLFYSGSGYYDGSYAVGVARAPAIGGPYTKRGPPILANSSAPVAFEGPGHCSVLQVADGTWAMVYHAWPGAARAIRVMMLDALQWGPDGWPSVGPGGDGAPSTTPQPIP
jgi:arabinan endo-1,5-alpha-L-arabinosidase